MHPIRLLVGLGNPGARYAGSRHNVGADLVAQFVAQQGSVLQPSTKWPGLLATFRVADHNCTALVPTTYMNASGRAVRAVAQYGRIGPEQILVVHDELDFSPGIVKLKSGGGHAGHNGLRDMITQLQSRDFHRLRLGIGHPGDASRVADYVLKPPSKTEADRIEAAIWQGLKILPLALSGQMEAAMRTLHA